MDKGSIDAGQSLHLVFGGEVVHLQSVQLRDVTALDVVGIFPDRSSAVIAWRGKAQQTVDNAMMRYFVVPIHQFLELTR